MPFEQFKNSCNQLSYGWKQVSQLPKTGQQLFLCPRLIPCSIIIQYIYKVAESCKLKRIINLILLYTMCTCPMCFFCMYHAAFAGFLLENNARSRDRTSIVCMLTAECDHEFKCHR